MIITKIKVCKIDLALAKSLCSLLNFAFEYHRNHPGRIPNKLERMVLLENLQALHLKLFKTVMIYKRTVSKLTFTEISTVSAAYQCYISAGGEKDIWLENKIRSMVDAADR